MSDALRRSRAQVAHALRAARSRIGGSAVVLTYHRVTRLECDPDSLAIAPDVFDAQMEVLASKYHVLTAAELCDRLARHRKIPSRSVVITVDDGYADLLSTIKPILQRHTLPATAFISTAEIDTDRERWWDEIAYLCSGKHVLPAEVSLSVAGMLFEHRVDASTGSAEYLRVALHAYLVSMSAAQRAAALDALFGTANIKRPTRHEYRSLTTDEVRALAAGPLVSVGAHTESHQRLSALDRSGQAAEIANGKERLERILGQPVRLFSYPHGSPDDIGVDSRRLVEEAGFSCAFANWFGLTFPWTHRYAIPRCPTEGLSAEQFEKRLDHWFAMGR